jgi:hypothetical protein
VTELPVSRLTYLLRHVRVLRLMQTILSAQCGHDPVGIPSRSSRTLVIAAELAAR